MALMTPLVFFSSTTEDLRAYRAAVRKAVAPLDILYRGMEFFGSQPRRPEDVILDELVQCDAYVGIIAHRYGSIVPGKECSFVELEYELASTNEIPAFIFLMSQKHLPEAHREASAEVREKLAAFKERVRKGSVVEEFTTPGDLATRVVDSLKK